MEQAPGNFKLVTAHNSLYLVERDGRLELRGHDKAVQSIVDRARPDRLEMENLRYLVSALLYIPPPRHILMLGTGAGSLLHYLRHHYPRARLSALDIDRELIDALRAREVLPAPDDRLEYICADAAEYLDNATERFDLVVVDLFFGAQTPPWLLAKHRQLQLHRLLESPGALAFNLLLDSEHDFQRFYRELQRLFRQQTLSIPVPGLDNRVVIGVKGDAGPRDMTVNLQRATELSAEIDLDLAAMLSLIYNTNPAGNGLL